MKRSFPSLLRLPLLVITLYASWLAMMAVHEMGHVLHAKLSGGRVVGVVVPAFGFSRTDVSPNPKPAFVAWGGPVWGALVPALLWVAVRRWKGLSRRVVTFFAGLCLVANGAYLGLGWMMTAGDAADLLRYGTPLWALILFGGVTLPAGLALWHTLGPNMGITQAG